MVAKSNESYECSRQTFERQNRDPKFEKVVTPVRPRFVMQANLPPIKEEHSFQQSPNSLSAGILYLEYILVC